jgi:hypothetical protein
VQRAVEVASFHQNELRAVTTLSPEAERRAAVLTAAGTAGVVLAAMIAGAVLVSLRGTVVHAPTFLVAWLGVAAAVASWRLAVRLVGLAASWWARPSMPTASDHRKSISSGEELRDTS